MEQVDAAPGRGFARTLAFMAASFALAFCVQTAVHEGGHWLAGSLAGEKGGRIILHPFHDSRVLFTHAPGTATSVFTGLAGPGLDLLLALPLALLASRWKSPLAFPALTWGALALFGEGLGMISSLASFGGAEGGRYYEDITQLFRLGVPPWPLWALAAGLAIAGVIMMALIAPRAGLGPGEGFLRRLAAFAAFLPTWFLAAVLWIRAFSPGLDNLGTRTGQLVVAAATAVLLAAIAPALWSLAAWSRAAAPRRPGGLEAALAARGMPVAAPRRPDWRELAMVAVGAAAAFYALLLA